MSNYLNVIKKEYRFYMESLKDDIASRRDPDYFWPSGTQVYCGRQGSGKTISAVRHVMRLKNRYPKALVVSNLLLNGVKKREFGGDKLVLKSLLKEIEPSEEYIYFSDMADLEKVLVLVNNGKYGVIYLVDEIHTYFNALESKNIPMFVFTEISQQRKQRKLIIGTSQLFMRMAKPFREQCDSLIVCNTHFGLLTTQRAYDGMDLDQDYSGNLIGSVKKRGWFFHSRNIRASYDTYQKVVSGVEQYEISQRVELQMTAKKNKISFKH